MTKIMIAGIPHSGSSAVTKLVGDLVKTADLPDDYKYKHPEHDWELFESHGLNIVSRILTEQYCRYVKEFLKGEAFIAAEYSFPNGSYVWKNLELQHNFDWWNEWWTNVYPEWKPDLVIICLRDPEHHAASMISRSGESIDLVIARMTNDYLLLGRMIEHIPTLVVSTDTLLARPIDQTNRIGKAIQQVDPMVGLNRAKDVIGSLKTDKLTTKKYKIFQMLYDLPGYKRLNELAKKGIR